MNFDLNILNQRLGSTLPQRLPNLSKYNC